MQYRVREVTDSDGAAVMEVFNHFVQNSFAAYPEKKVPEAYFAALRTPGDKYPLLAAETAGGTVIGFGMLRQHHRAEAFNHTAEIGYFILDEHCGKGIGSRFLAMLEQAGRERGIQVLLANISSFNEKSLRFHERNGFTECGRFRKIGIKFGREFDVVWMQKFL